jgi:prepilin-type N-terminal cleavage/methylation domain-containing protein
MMQKIYMRFKKLLSHGPVGNREGFTLIEMLMVLMILTVGIIPIAVIQHRARREVTEADKFTTAVVIAQDQLEGLKGLGFGVAQTDSGYVDNVKWVGTVTNVSFGLDRVEIKATWESDGQTEQITIADLVSLR